MSTSQNPYAPVKAAVQRWLERSHSAEYHRKKKDAKRLQYELATLTRNARRTGDSQAIALIDRIKPEMLSRSR